MLVSIDSCSVAQYHFAEKRRAGKASRGRAALFRSSVQE